ncbi:MAG: ABC transporter permease [Acidobacteria bacterium]|nr:ABC transporter permease [Acidobacteriota bacterium]MCZ6726413.1 ABC transporter permease [Acidobacteriota bacterium]
MIRYTLYRLAQTAPLALLVCALVFSLIHLIPGDPVEIMLGDGAQPAEVEALRHELGLDRPLGRQFVDYFVRLARLDLGESLRFRQPVTRLLAAHYPATLELAFASMLAALALALPLGVVAALNRDRALDHGARFLALLGVSIPNFWLGPMLIWLLAIRLDLLPVSGRGGMASLVLPAITLGTALAGMLTRMVRSSLAEELGEPYLVVAQAKGLGYGQAVARHAFRNASIPVVTVVGLQFGALLTGAIITETIFSWPGIGRLIVQAIQARDYPLVQGGILTIALSYLVINLLTDLTYALLDARIRLR